MLILMRKLGEVIVINGGTDQEIKLVVRHITPGRVSLGIAASRDVKIVRGELKEAE